MSGLKNTPVPAAPAAAMPTPRLPTSTYVLSLCQAINLIAAVLSVTVAAIVGAKLAPRPEWLS